MKEPGVARPFLSEREEKPEMLDKLQNLDDKYE